ncbi:MAG: hypothetical protein K2W82_15955 [Candidatus Obscuribacterales bacterium]|nr:hypothetical protein [Candidatus Obscuribacterales bacterium]
MTFVQLVLLSALLLFLVFGVRVLVTRLFQLPMLAGVAGNRPLMAMVGGLCRAAVYGGAFLLLGAALSVTGFVVLWAVLSLLDYFMPVTGAR